MCIGPFWAVPSNGWKLKFDPAMPAPRRWIEKLMTLPGPCPDAAGVEQRWIMDPPAPNMVQGHLLSHLPAAIANAIGVATGRREQQQARRFDGPGGQDNQVGPMLLISCGLVLAIDQCPRRPGCVEDDAPHRAVGVYGAKTSRNGL